MCLVLHPYLEHAVCRLAGFKYLVSRPWVRNQFTSHKRASLNCTVPHATVTVLHVALALIYSLSSCVAWSRGVLVLLPFLQHPHLLHRISKEELPFLKWDWLEKGANMKLGRGHFGLFLPLWMGIRVNGEETMSLFIEDILSTFKLISTHSMVVPRQNLKLFQKLSKSF